MRRIAACLALLAGALFTPALAAEECTAPCFGYDLSTKMNLDWIIGSHPSDFRSTDFYPSFEGEFWFSPAEHLKLVSHLTTEPVLDKVPGENRYFGDVGTYAEELYALIEFDPLTVRIGKIDAGLSLASDVLSGINSTNLVGNFDTDQSWGGEAAVTFDAMGLPQRLTLDAFTTDRTFLSQSLFTNRGRLRLSEGEAGNTTGLSSFSAILDGCVGADANECYDQGRFGYRLAARYQRAGHRTQDQIDEDLKAYGETALLAAITSGTGDEDHGLRLLAEGGFLRHFEGGSDDAFVGTLSAGYITGPMLYQAAYTLQHDMVSGGPDVNEHLANLSAAYNLSDGVELPGGEWIVTGEYTFTRDADGQNDHLLSLELEIKLDGTLGGSTKGKSEPD